MLILALNSSTQSTNKVVICAGWLNHRDGFWLNHCTTHFEEYLQTNL